MSKSGFTLIELLVTTAITSILVSMSIMNYNMFRRKANEAAVMQQMHDIAASVDLHVADLELNDGGFSNPHNIQIRANGTMTVGSASYVPGYKHTKGVVMSVSYSKNSMTNNKWLGFAILWHCAGGPGLYGVDDERKGYGYSSAQGLVLNSWSIENLGDNACDTY